MTESFWVCKHCGKDACFNGECLREEPIITQAEDEPIRGESDDFAITAAPVPLGLELQLVPLSKIAYIRAHKQVDQTPPKANQ